MNNMPSPASRFGKLTIVDSHVEAGRRYVSCTCDCGRTTDKLWRNVMTGRTTSCGKGACRAGVQYEPTALPSRGPRAISLRRLRMAWERYNHEVPVQRRSIEQLAVIYRVNRNTLHTLFRTIKRSGGFEQYHAAVTANKRGKRHGT
jgi:hypothetical protein